MARSRLHAPGSWAVGLIVLVCAFPVGAQPTITHAAVDARLSSSGTETTYEIDDGAGVAGLQILADRSGGGQVWDLTPFSWSVGTAQSYGPATPPVPGSGFEGFDEATHIVMNTDKGSAVYTYYRLEADGLKALGFAAEDDDGAGGVMEIGLRLLPSDLLFPLPLTSTSAWSSTYTVEFVPDESGAATTTEEEETATVDGWGTLVTPAGSVSVLKHRTRTITTRTTSLGGNTIVSRDTSYCVEFISAEDVGSVIDLDQDGAVTGASYSVFDTSGGTAGAGPLWDDGALRLAVEGANPVRRGATVTVGFALPAPGAVRLEAFDALGRRVASLAEGPFGTGPQRASFATDAIPPGVYLVRLLAEGQAAVRPVTVVE